MKITNLLQIKEGLSTRQFALDVLAGFSRTPKNLASKYFYDDRGSEIFQQIGTSADYYLTKREFMILEQIGDGLPRVLGIKDAIDIVELGVGDGHKSRLIIDAFLRANIRVHFFPIDISEQAMLQLKENMPASPLLSVEGIVAEYFQGLTYVKSLSKNPQLVLFLGSNIGNFTRAETKLFLSSLHCHLNSEDHVLIGFDQKKNAAILNSAYNDAQGYTEAFNINLLTRMNRELGANFMLSKFEHYGFYNPLKGAMESHLISRTQQLVHFAALERTFSFEKYEPLHVEYSFKFLPADIAKLSEQAGFTVVNNFSDAEQYFIDSLWKINLGR